MTSLQDTITDSRVDEQPREPGAPALKLISPCRRFRLCVDVEPDENGNATVAFSLIANVDAYVLLRFTAGPQEFEASVDELRSLLVRGVTFQTDAVEVTR